MFSSIRGFLTRHRRKFITGTVVVGGVIFLTRYTQRKLREWQEKEIRDMMERSKRLQYFKCTERACHQMILSLAATLRESIIKAVDTNAIVNKLRNGYTDKVASWNELKVLAIARSAVIIYSHAMLATLIRIQFNLMGGHIYKDIQKTDGIGSQGDLQTAYMSLSSYFMNDGINKLCTLVKDKVAEITASMSLKDNLTLRDLEQIYWAITSSISADSSKDPAKNLAEYMLQPIREEQENSLFQKLMNETLDLLESEEVQNLTQSNIRSGFVLLIDHISEYFTGPPVKQNGTHAQNGISLPGTSNQNNDTWTDNGETEMSYNNAVAFIDVNKVSMSMAKVIPIISGQVPDKPTPNDVPSDLLQSLIQNNDLKTLGANIYEAFSF